MELIDQFEETLLAARRARFGGGVSVDRDRLLDLVDQIRASVPTAIADAQGILHDRQQILARANEEAEVVAAKARQEADAQLSGHDLIRKAQLRASEIIKEATQQAQQITKEARTEATAIRGSATSQAIEQAIEADRYSLDVLRRLESQLAALLTSIRAGIEQLSHKLEQEQEQRSVALRDARIREQHTLSEPD